MKKKLSVLLACLLVFTLALAGCQDTASDEGTTNEGTTNEGTTNENTNSENTSNENNETNEPEEGGALSGTVNTDGSTSMADVMAALTAAFK